MSDLVYLDHAASTALRPEVARAYADCLLELSSAPGNPNSTHSAGRANRALLEDARARLAQVCGADAAEVIFTSGGSEADAIAVGGAARYARKNGLDQRVLVLATEHPAVVKAAGENVQMIAVQADGIADLAALDELLKQGVPVLVSVASAANETGVIQPVAQVVRRCQEDGVLVHTDAVQAFGHIPFSFHDLGVGLASIAGHKFGGPGGTGALLARRDVKIISDRVGGGQERSLRGGTQDVAGAQALALAAEIAVAEIESERVRLTQLRELLLHGVADLYSRGELSRQVRPSTMAQTLPGTVHLLTDTRHPEVVLLEMDRAGICVSAGSACSAGVVRPSPALLAMGYDEETALGGLRVSLGYPTTATEVNIFLAALARALTPAWALDEFEGIR